MLVEYIWIDGENCLRSKTRVLKDVKSIDDIPEWNFDGSSTYQSTTQKSDLILKPVAMFRDPFRTESDKLVLCEVYDGDVPHASNTRAKCKELFETAGVKEKEFWFGIEQEYVLFDRNNIPYGWKSHDNPGIGDQGPYYCGVGGDKAFGRDITEMHIILCLMAGVKICGLNAEVMPSQWEFQIGPIGGIEVSDHLWIARYILNRITEKYNCYASFHPKPYTNENKWNGSGCHTNISTKDMREEGGIEFINEAIEKLRLTHKEHIENYGKYNEMRLSGKHETSNINSFTFGKLDRSSSIRIPVNVLKEGKGYFEDRRPAANMDPYVVTYLICKNII
jgi:glutamine synthetase